MMCEIKESKGEGRITIAFLGIWKLNLILYKSYLFVQEDNESAFFVATDEENLI